jgi:hypothetical protein
LTKHQFSATIFVPLEEANEDPAFLSTDFGHEKCGAFLSRPKECIMLFSLFLALAGCHSTLDSLVELPFDDEGAETADCETETTAPIESAEVETIDRACEFPINTWEGEVLLGNALSIALNANSPGGEKTPSRIDVLMVDFTATDPNCSDLLVTSYGIKGIWTDNAGSGWYPDWVVAYVDGEYIDGEEPFWPTGHEVFAQMGPVYIPAGKTVTVTIAADLFGANAELDDSVQFSLLSSSIGVYDGETEPVTLLTEEELATGNTILF